MRLTRTRKAVAGVAALVAAALWGAAGCDSASAHHPAPSTKAAAAAAGGAPRPVPHGRGSRIPYDFNGDGHRDLVVDDLAKGDSHGDDAGIAVVYGTGSGRVLDPAARQVLTTRRDAAPVGGEPPATFDAEAACDLDGDGFGDLIVTPDPSYDGVGRPPVPLQVLFGGPGGLTGRAVVLGIPSGPGTATTGPTTPSAATSTATARPTSRSPRPAGASASCAARSPAPAPRARRAPRCPGAGPSWPRRSRGRTRTGTGTTTSW